MDAAQELLKLAIDAATRHGIEIPSDGKCIYEANESENCPECPFSTFCNTLAACYINVLTSMINDSNYKPLEDIDKNFMLASSGIEPIIDE